MKKQLLFPIVILATFFNQIAFSQNKEVKKVDAYHFDEKAAYEDAKAKGIKDSELNGYVRFLKNDFYSKQDLAKQGHKHTPYEVAGTPGIQETVIYLEPNKPMSLGCPNMGFEQYNFNGWTGGIGTVSTGPVGGNPNYTSTGTAIVNTAGNNVLPNNTVNYHTVMSLPPVNPVTPFNGYDPYACKSTGTQTVSEIPYVSPYSFDPVSVRMNGTNSNYRACRLKYITTASSTNQRLSFSYAVVLESPGHLANESPYFKVEVRNENTGAILPGCTSYTFNPVSSLPSDSLKTSVISVSGSVLKYRKWQYYSVDLSSLPAGTNVSLNFEVGGCSQSGHFGYAYVDAECGGIGTPYANMCSGSNFATLIAPTGFNTYQWYGPSGLIPGATNDTLFQGPPSGSTPNPGDVYTVSMISPGGCTVTQTVSVGFTTVNIINLNATSSCPGGNSGTASVQASGSNGIYTYSWTNTGTGAPAGTSQTVTGLAPGTYSVLVSSTTCGQASANLSVGVSPPFFVALSKPFCGNATIIPQPGGSSYTWYQNSVLIAAPAGTNDTLYINNAVNNDIYTVVYNNAQGCRDSIQYTLTQVAGGSTYFSNTSNVCPGGTNGATQLNLSTPFSAPYSYVVTGPTSSSVVTSTTTSTTTLNLTSLAPGTYTAVINDGVCIYNNTVTIGVIATNFTITPTNTVLCYPEAATVNFDFGETAPSVCGLSTTGGCASPSSTQMGFGTNVNTTTSYPAIYGNWYRNTRHQILYKASELIAAGITAGKISSISFNITTINGTTSYPDFSIKLKCTNEQDMSSTSFDQVGLTQVYSAASINIATGWNTYTFGTPYEWDGVSNLLIDVCNSQTMPSYTQNSSSPYAITPFASVRWYNSDGTVACPIPTGSSFAPNNTYRPNIKFEHCGASNPSSYTVAVSANGTITTNYGNDSLKVTPVSIPSGNGSVVYTFSVTNPVGGCVATQTLEVLYPPLTTSITTAVTNTILCEGDNTLLSVGGAFNYDWYYQQGSTSIPISTSDTITVVPPAIGTNTYIVTGYAPCPSSTPDTKTITVTVIPKTSLFVSPIQDLTKCMNKSFVLTTGVGSTIPSNQGTPYSYSWTTLPANSPAPGATNAPSYTVTSNTTSTFVVTVSGVCAYSTSDTVVVSNFVDDLGVVINDTSSACAGTPFILNALASGGYPNYFYEWKFLPSYDVISTSSSLNLNSPDIEGNYSFQVVVTDSCGYTRNDIQVINVLPPCSIEVPNVITPNGDGTNDFFKIKNIEHHPNTNVTIFDRWGIKVYENPNYNNEWNGAGVSDGTFFYVIDVPDDKKYSGFISVFKGK